AAVLTIVACVFEPLNAADPLPRTALLEWPEEDLSGRMMDGAHRFVQAQIVEAHKNRRRFWNYDTSSPLAWERTIKANRERLSAILGAAEPRLTPRMERFGDDASPALVAETSHYRIYQVRWPVLEGVFGEGLLVQPRGDLKAHLVIVPDCNQIP